MGIELAKDPKAVYSNEEQTMIDCDVLIDGEVTIRFTASKNDPLDHGRALFVLLKKKYSKSIGAYVPPEPPPQIEA